VFYAAHRTRILIAAILCGMAVLNFLWFAAALRPHSRIAGRDGWGSGGDRLEWALGVLFLLLIAHDAALAILGTSSAD